VDSVQLVKEDARGVTKFVLQLGDNGVGIDKSTVTSEAFTLKRNGTTLVAGTDYLFRYFENSNQVVFESAAFFPLGTYVLTATTRPTVAGGAVGLLTDLANNTLLSNQSNGTTTFAITLADVPSVPTAVAGTPGEELVSLSWAAPAASGAAAVTDYKIEFSSNGGTTWTPFADAVSMATSAVVTGLANGAAYVFRVAAVNSVGQSEWSAASATVTPQALPPSTPTGLAGLLGDGSVSLSWTAPSPGTSPITDYEIQFSSNGGSSWTSFSDGTSTATTATVTPLVNGTAYVFRVRAVNKNGPSDWTAASAAVTPLAPASAPLVTSVLAGDSQVTVTWTTPANNGSPISGYVIQSSSNGGSTWTSTNVGIVNSAPVTGLVNGTAYVFRVAAVTGFGTGTFSAVTTSATPLGPSAAPSVTSVAAGDSQATVSWTTPASNGSPISGYTVEYTSNGGVTWTPTSLGLVNTTVVAGLVNGTTYSFRVAAVTGFGTGLYSTPTALVTPLGPAAAPSVATVIGGDSQVSLSWGTPSGNGSAITGYVLQRSTDGGVTWTSTDLGVVNSTVVGGLVNGTSYVFRLAAVTAFGTGTFSTPTSPVTPLGLPGTPTGLSVTGGDRTAAVSWTAPAVTGGRPIIDYVVQYRDVTSGTWLTLVHPASTATSAVVSGLTNGATYVFRVAAVTSFGQGGFTAESAAVSPLPLAGAPTRLTGRAADGTVSLVWTAPRVTGGFRITDYVIDYSSDGGVTWTRVADAVSAATRATVAVPNGVTYVFRVAAVTAGGVGAFSLNSGPLTPFSRAAKPDAPTAVVGIGAGGTIALSWVGSPANAGGRVSDYVIQYRLSTSGRWVTVRDGVSSSTSAIVSRLVAGRGYVFRVAAKNLAGQGAFSAETAEVIA
jgi:titin